MNVSASVLDLIMMAIAKDASNTIYIFDTIQRKLFYDILKE